MREEGHVISVSNMIVQYNGVTLCPPALPKNSDAFQRAFDFFSNL